MEIKAYLNPNPVLRGEILTNPWDKKFETKNNPFLEIVLCNFPLGEYNIEILSPLFLKQKAIVTSSYASTYFLNPEFEDPFISQVKLKVVGEKLKKELSLPVKIHKLTGRAFDFNENPFPAYIWATHEEKVVNEIIVKTGNEGRFTLYYPEEKKLRVFVDDASYSKSTLECWIIAKELREDMEINPHIGDFELYDFNVWFSSGIWHIFFMPSSLKSLDSPPELTKDDINVWINGMKAEIKSLIVHQEYTGKDKYYPACLLNVIIKEKEFCSPVLVRAQVNSPEKGKGEAWYIY